MPGSTIRFATPAAPVCSWPSAILEPERVQGLSPDYGAVIDKVEVKMLSELSPREIEHDNPEIRRTEDMASFLSQLYNREVTPDDTVTVIRFSQIKD